MSPTASRTVRLFRNGRNQAVRIPVEFEFAGDEVTISRESDRVVIAPARKRTLLEVLESLEAIEDEEFVEIDDPPPEPENIF